MVDGPPATATRSGRLGYLPGLDGVRAISVSAVFLHHAGLLDGGFLGVDVFFVISGFLITALAVGEIEDTGRLGLGGFWARRARRLLPALFALCTAVVVWSALIEEGARATTREVTATILYVANWDRLREGYEYFAAYDEPSLLEHTWSLAIEEQFYIVWPVLLVGAVLLSRRTRWAPRWTIAGVALVGAVASAGWSWWSAADGTELNRLYFGTDTRAVGLAVGCAAGCVVARGTATGARRIGVAATAAAVAGAAVLGVMMVQVDGGERWLYQSGFPIAALASLAVVNAASGEGIVARLLSVAPLAALGRVSYGVYLWHWPVIEGLDGDRLGLSGLALWTAWVVITGALTAASWFLIERRAPLPRRELPVRGIAYAAVAVVILVAAAIAPTPGDTVDDLVLPTPTTTSPPTTTAAGGDGTTSTTAAPTTTVPTTTVPPRPVRMLILGDSIAESLGEPTESPFVIEGREVEVVNRSVIACPVTFEGRWAFDDGRLIGDPLECDDDGRFTETVAEVDPDLIFFLFGWAGGIAGRELDDGAVVAPCDQAFDERYGAAYAELVDRFDEDAVVVVGTVAPPTEFSDLSQADRPACLNEVITALDAPVFDFGEWLCPAADCTTAATLRRDTVHFAGSAAVRDLVWPAIVAEVVATAEPALAIAS